MVKILHTGDIHLDSPMSSLHLAAAEAARDKHRQTFRKMMQYAIDEKVDMLLISGDMFDGKYITKQTKDMLISCFAEFAKPVVIAPGNHDPYYSVSIYKDGSLPKNVYVFSSDELQIFDFEQLGVSVYGYAFLTPSLTHSPLAQAEHSNQSTCNTRILCAHADINAPISNYGPVLVEDIEKFDFSYAALGHIHNPPTINSSNTVINYCGFLFGRSFDELGEGGAYLVSIDGDKTNVEKVSFASHRFIKEELDVSGAKDNGEITERISAHVSKNGYGKDISLCLSLVGTVPIELLINKTVLEKSDTELFELKIKDLTTPVPDNEYLKNDPSLRGEFYRNLLPSLTSEDIATRKLASEALYLGLCAIDGINVTAILGADDEKKG